jgi:hypothetical protein
MLGEVPLRLNSRNVANLTVTVNNSYLVINHVIDYTVSLHRNAKSIFYLKTSNVSIRDEIFRLVCLDYGNSGLWRRVYWSSESRFLQHGIAAAFPVEMFVATRKNTLCHKPERKSVDHTSISVFAFLSNFAPQTSEYSNERSNMPGLSVLSYFYLKNVCLPVFMGRLSILLVVSLCIVLLIRRLFSTLKNKTL